MIEFTVYGRAQQRGSKIPIGKKGGGYVQSAAGRVILKDSNPKSGDWMNAVKHIAACAYERSLMLGPVKLSVTFYFRRPKCHYRTGKNAHLLRADAPQWHTSTPDLAKLVRCLEDALTGVVWRDDKQVCMYGDLAKCWTEESERAEVSIEELA